MCSVSSFSAVIFLKKESFSSYGTFSKAWLQKLWKYFVCVCGFVAWSFYYHFKWTEKKSSWVLFLENSVFPDVIFSSKCEEVFLTACMSWSLVSLKVEAELLRNVFWTVWVNLNLSSFLRIPKTYDCFSLCLHHFVQMLLEVMLLKIRDTYSFRLEIAVLW